MKAVNKTIATALFTVGLSSGCGTNINLEPKDEGARLFLNNCAQCHLADGSGKQEIGAPSLAGLPDWYIERQLNNFYNGLRGAHPDDVEGLRMRPMARTFIDRQDKIPVVAKYVASLPAVSPSRHDERGNADAGKGIYDGVCATCHGADGKGIQNSEMYPALPNLAPSLVIADDWYMIAQLQKFTCKVRGVHPDDKYGREMANMSMVVASAEPDPDNCMNTPPSTAMLDVVAYIKELPQ
jgi:cytochrome c553